MKALTNTDVIRSIQERLTALDNERVRLVKALNLLTVTELVAQDTAIKRKLQITDGQPKAKKKRRRHAPWSPASNASSYVQTLYDALEDGSNLTTAQLSQRVHNAGYDDITESQVSGSLSWMKASGRLTQNKGHWRRKFARYAKKDEPITSDKITGKNAHKVMGRLDRRVERGEYTKSVDANGRVTWTPNAPSSGTDQ